MFPTLSIYNSGNLILTYIERFGYGGLIFPIKSTFFYFPNVFLGNFACVMGFPHRKSFSFHRISGIFYHGSKIKMVWVGAFPVIALMKNPKPIGYYPIMNYPRNPVGLKSCFIYPYISVTAMLASSPAPTIFRFNNFAPKLFKVFRGWVDKAIKDCNSFCRFIHTQLCLSLVSVAFTEAADASKILNSVLKNKEYCGFKG